MSARLEQVFRCRELCDSMLMRLKGISTMMESFANELVLLRTTLEGIAAQNSMEALHREVHDLRAILAVSAASGGLFV